jgi:hypothetical protein
MSAAKAKIATEEWVDAVIAALHGMLYGAHLMIHLRDYAGAGATCGAAQADAMMALCLLRDPKSEAYQLIRTVRDQLHGIDEDPATFPDHEHSVIVELESKLAAHRGRPLRWFDCKTGEMIQ